MQEFIAYLSENPIAVASIAIGAVMGILAFVYAYFYARNDKARLDEWRSEKYRKQLLEGMDTVVEDAKQQKQEKKEKTLKANGLTYMSKNRIGVTQYEIIRVVVVLCGAIIGSQLFGLIGLLAGVVLGWVLPGWALKQSNEGDNAAMLDSIKDIYDTARIQASNDVYITDVLNECYLVTKHPRLKQALYELITEINGHGDIAEAVDNFAGKFDNPYIDALAISIRQSLISGSAAKVFNDVSRQIDAIDEAIIIREQEKAEQINTIVQALVYVGILVVCFYLVIVAASDLMTIF